MLLAETPAHTLLPTQALTREVRALQGPSNGNHANVAKLRQTVGSFIVRQIDADPAISNCDLQKQLNRAFEKTEGDCGGPGESYSMAPRVFARPDGPNRRVFVVTYTWFGFYAKHGSETILESYVWENDRGTHLGAGIVPDAFSGYLTHSQEVCWFNDPDRLWVLVAGQVGGASGQVLGATAGIFEVGAKETKQIWTTPPGIGNLAAYVPQYSQRWEIEYADTKRFYAQLPQSVFLDVYQIDYGKRAFRRLIHQPLY